MTSRLAAVRLNKVIAKAMAGMLPPDDLTVTEWAEQNRRLSAESAAEPGPWRTERTPYLREPDERMDRPEGAAHRHGGRIPGRQVRISQ